MSLASKKTPETTSEAFTKAVSDLGSHAKQIFSHSPWRWGKDFSDALLTSLSPPTLRKEDFTMNWTIVLGFTFVQKS